MPGHVEVREQLGRILVVEDERIVALDLVRTLEDLGYAVVDSVATGEAAIARERETSPDIVLMDIRLAGELDGIGAAAALRHRRGVPVIYLTAHTDEDTLRRAKQTEPFGYLVKPFKAVELRCAIEIALHKHEIDSRLRERERWLATTLRSIGDGVLATDTAQQVTLMNPVAEALTGWPADDALGQRLGDIMRLVSEHGHAPIENSLERAVHDRAVAMLSHDARLIARTGASIAIADSAAPIIDDGGELRGGVMVFRDVTDQRKADQELRRFNAELEQRVGERTAELETANRELEAFSASVAHDLRAPLRHIEGFSQILLEEHTANLGADGVDLLRRVRAATTHMTHLIDDLLRLSRVGNVPLVKSHVDVSAMALAVVTGLKAASRDHVAPRVTIADRLEADADPGLLRIVLHNLLGNAWKFTARTPGPEIAVGAHDDGGRRAIFVRDNGAGFDVRRADKLFGAFQRFHPASEFEGNGMGLAIVERIVKRHGGRVWADSRPGAGATFYVVL